MDDLDLCNALVTTRWSKGGKRRVVPLGRKAGKAIDRYLRQARSGHRRPSTPGAVTANTVSKGTAANRTCATR